MTSPSSLGRVAACLRSETLEHVEEVTEPAHLGTVAHRYLCNVLLHGPDEALAMERIDDRSWLVGLDIARLPAFHPDLYAPEIAFAYRPETGTARELGRGISREEAHRLAKPGELVGIADVAGVAPEGVVIGDYKTGWGWVDPANVNWQVKTYALMAARAWGKDEAVVSIIRARADGFVWPDSYHMDFFALEEHELALRSLLAARERVLLDASKGEPLPHFVEGSHCTYCPARRICPPKTAQILALSADAAPAVGEDGKPIEMTRLGNRLTPELAPLVWQKLRFAEKMVERLQAELKEYARREPIPLGDGWVLGERAKATETIVAEKAVPLLIEAYGAELGQVIAGASVKHVETMAKESLSAALSKYVLPTMGKKEAKISRVKEAVFQRFREGGAMTVKPMRVIDEHKVKPVEEEKPVELEQGAA